MPDKLFLTAKDVSMILEVSLSKAYRIIRALNEKLEAEGYIVVAGRVARKRFEERCYGIV